MNQQLSAIKELLSTAQYITYATVNQDGSPHNSPMFFIPSSELTELYIGTHPGSLHADNIVRTGQAFGVVFGRVNDIGVGAYFKLENCREAAGNDLDKALAAHNTARSKLGKAPLEKSYYEQPSPQRMYVCDIVEISTNGVVRDKDGHIARDTRNAIAASQIIN